MRILLLGKSGQVGWELQRALAPLGEVVALDRHGEQGLCGDLANLDGLTATLRALDPDVIVNAAAYTAVDKAESEPELALRINGEAPGVLAREAARLGAWLVHYSTDYVFDGSGEQPWREDAPTGPLSVYGRSKLAGEAAIVASGARALVFRTSWVYAARGGNFAKTMLRLARERDQLRVIADQIGAPTGAELIADVTAHALRQVMGSADASPLGGVYHLAAAGETSWFDYARFVLLQAEQAGEALKVGHGQIEAIPTSAYPTPAQRPLNSRLDTTKLQETFGLHLPNWQDGVARMLTETTKD
ncbi:dTDP-4-dehydrorhamnose reductase [Azotobacter beijerinckii]|uniref:dTDP-4-dehydrorhamnose reductase n=1 Tax=Azotobacter beijerinckii TaxID=170623 RepID=A0A1I3ZU77_9GAMM|nr:dTDP-4-dehydrorhamnose reductase [Azotobacter beijerinckii]SFA85406.1 dTDP-4-dehydrorhamnose reductase [Azotobacter beijerinckii]SFK47724.1 dTDP-4-dehydrorhamnose reductase [Azotobacter beijerinckii]